MALSPSWRPFSVLSRMFGGAAEVFEPRRAQPLPVPPGGGSARPVRDLYDLLWAYYTSNSLYDDVTLALAVQGIAREALKPLRNPANRVVEFHAAHIWPGTLPDALPIEPETGNPRLIDALHLVWKWSKWAQNKQVLVRKASCLGDAFVRVAVTTGPDGEALPPEQTRVYFQLIEPRHVPDFEVDERGFVTMLRVDVPRALRDPVTGTRRWLTHTEVWEHDPPGVGRVRQWLHDRGDEPDLERLGAPLKDQPLTDYGIDFVPFVHLAWRDAGELRGMGAFTHAVDKIDEANRVATRLHQQLYRSNAEMWVLEGAGRVDDAGREIPPPAIAGLAASTSGADGLGTVQVGADRYALVPGGWALNPKVPGVNFGASLEVLNAHVRELEQDLPELVYARLQEAGTNLSGRAVRFLLSGAVDRAIEARGNCEAALVRLDQMALTLGQVAGLPQFASGLIGTYAGGDFEHQFEERDILPSDTLEDAQADLARAQALKTRSEAVAAAPALLLEEAGYDAGQIAELLRERAERQAAAQPVRLVRRVERDAEGRIAAVVNE